MFNSDSNVNALFAAVTVLYSVVLLLLLNVLLQFRSPPWPPPQPTTQVLHGSSPSSVHDYRVQRDWEIVQSQLLEQQYHFRQVGVLTDTDGDLLYPLYGKRSRTHRERWNYYTITNRLTSIRIPIQVKSRDCTVDLGCEELYSGDTVTVPVLNREFTVTIYDNEAVW